MDEKFMETLKSMSKDVVEESQNIRPETAYRPMISSTARIPSAMGRPGTGVGGGHRKDPSSDDVTTLASYRPESAAFTKSFNFNRPRTGRLDSSERGLFGTGAAPPSARPGRQASSRPRSTFRRNDESDSYIPDLEEVREDDLTMTVASAPNYELQRMASLSELDAELSQTKALSVVDGVNLRKLCKFLVPEKELSENDELWTWDRLYTEIISTPELNHLVRFQKKDNESDYDSLSMK